MNDDRPPNELKAIIEEIKGAIDSEFRPIGSRFSPRDFSIQEARNCREEAVQKPGVYVFLLPTGKLLRIGRHLRNTLWRVQQHWNVWIKHEFPQMEQDGRVLLFTVEWKDRHWAAALEVFLELRFGPTQRRI